MGFEKDIESLKIALTETEFRIKKLEEHKEIINKLLRDNKTEESWINETRIRLVRNIRNLQKKRDMIFRELVGVVHVKRPGNSRVVLVRAKEKKLSLVPDALDVETLNVVLALGKKKERWIVDVVVEQVSMKDLMPVKVGK